MQPYQEATQEISRQGQLPLNMAKNIGKAGAAALGSSYLAGGVINRVLPFLSKYIPEDLAIKGLTKVDPRYGKFIQTALAAGESFDKIKDVIGQKIEESEKSQQEPAKQSRNIIKQYDPELHKYIEMSLKKGMSLMDAGKRALSHGRFKNSVDKLTKDHKTSWDAVLRNVFGEGASYQEPSEEQQQQGQPQGQPQQGMPQQPQQQGAQGQGIDPAVAQIMQQGYQILKSRRGQ